MKNTISSINSSRLSIMLKLHIKNKIPQKGLDNNRKRMSLDENAEIAEGKQYGYNKCHSV
jgi:hypothetical protein